MKARFRKLWVSVHRWLGLTAGLLFVLLGLTGSLLVFDHAIDEWLHPELLLTEGGGAPHSPSEIVRAAERARGEKSPSAFSASAPRIEGGVWSVWFQTGTEETPRWTQVCVDPYTAEVTGQRVWGTDVMSWIYKLHFALHGGEIGEATVGIAGLALMISVATGVYLWWPLWKNGWRAALAIRRGRRLNYDMHKTLGIVLTPFLLVIAFTGVYMVFPEWIKPVVTTFACETPPPDGLASSRHESNRLLKPEEAVHIAQELVPATARLCHFHPPQTEDGVYEVAFRQRGEVQRSFGRTQIWIDAYSGEVLAMRFPEDFTVADTFMAWQFPLHNGEAFGLVGRWVVFCAGLAPAVLYATGFVMWWRKRRSRQRQSRGRAVRRNRRDRPPQPSTAPISITARIRRRARAPSSRTGSV